MRIGNRSHYRTDDLRWYVRHVAKQELTDDQSASIASVEFLTRGERKERKIVTSALGVLARRDVRCLLSLPVPGALDPGYLCVALARVFAEARNVPQHQQLQVARYGYRLGWQAFWAPLTKQRPLRRKAERKPTKLTPYGKIVRKKQHAEKMVKLWERKRKLAETKIKSWQRAARLYDRRIRARQPKVLPDAVENG